MVAKTMERNVSMKVTNSMGYMSMQKLTQLLLFLLLTIYWSTDGQSIALSEWRRGRYTDDMQLFLLQNQ